MYIERILANYGFHREGSYLYGGFGSIANGEEFYLKEENGAISIQYHFWYWDGGDIEGDEVQTMSVPAHEALTYMLTMVSRWYR